MKQQSFRPMPSSEDQVSAEGSRGTETNRRNVLPEAGIYSPNYHAVNQLLYSPGGTGQIGFMNVLQNTSARTVAEQQALYDAMEVNQGVSQVDTAYKQQEEQFFNENPTGRGYTDFATGVYQQLSDAAIVNGSNANVQNRMKLVFDARKNDIANNAFQKEKEIYTGYALNEVETQLNTTINEVTSTPDQVKSLSTKFAMQLEGMKNILSAPEFQKYSTTKSQGFTEGYGLGLIMQDPYRAQELLQSEEFKKLPNNRYVFLLNQAKREVQHREHQARALQSMQDMTMKMTENMRFEEMSQLIYTGSVSDGDIEAAQLSTRNKEKLLKLNKKYWNDRADQALKENWIDDCIKENIPTEAVTVTDEDGTVQTISQKDKDRYIDKYFNSEDERRMGEGKPGMSISEQMKWLSDHSMVFDKIYQPLQSRIVSSLTNSKDPNAILDASIAVSSARSTLFSDSTNKLKDLASLVVDYYKGIKGTGGIVEFRDSYFEPKRDWNEEVWNNKDSNPWKKDASTAFKNFCDKYGYEFNNGFWSKLFKNKQEISALDADYSEIRGRVLGIVKRVTNQMGSVSLGESAANSYMKKLILQSDINGSTTAMINPPTKENTGLEPEQIKNVMYGMAKHLMSGENMSSEKSIEYINGLINQAKAKSFKAALPNVQADIDGKTEKRQLMFEHASLDEPIYNVYYLYKEDDPNSKEFLRDRFGLRQIIDFNKIKSVIKRDKNG